MKTITINAIKCASGHEAIQLCDCGPDYRDPVAVLLPGGAYVMERAESHRIEAAGVEFAYLHDMLHQNGRHIIVTVPVN